MTRSPNYPPSSTSKKNRLRLTALILGTVGLLVCLPLTSSATATAVPQPGDCDIVTDGVSPPRCTTPGEKVVDHCASPATGERGTTYYTDGTTGWTQQCANLWDMEKRPTTQQGSGLTLESCTDANEGDVTTSSKGTLVCRNGQWTIQ